MASACVVSISEMNDLTSFSETDQIRKESTQDVSKSWLASWPGIRYQKRFQFLDYDSESDIHLNHYKKETTDLDLNNYKKETTTDITTIGVTKTDVVMNTSSNVWFTGDWDAVFPANLSDTGFPVLETNVRSECIIYEPNPPQVDAQMTEDEFANFFDAFTPPYLSYKIYSTKTRDMFQNVSEYLTARTAFLKSSKGSLLVQKTVTYKISGLDDDQRDNITAFMEMLLERVFEEQEDSLPEDFEATEFNPKTDDYPLPRSSLLNEHIQILHLETEGDDWILTIGYEVLESERNSYRDSEIPDELEIQMVVEINSDFTSMGQDESPPIGPNVMTSDEGNPAILYSLIFERVI